MVCLGKYAIVDGLLSFLCSLQHRLSGNSKSARIISMTRLHRLRGKSNIKKRFAGRLQQSNLLLVWSQRNNNTLPNSENLSQAKQHKAKLLHKSNKHSGVMSNEDTEEYLICSAL
jgi:hypothetical protein